MKRRLAIIAFVADFAVLVAMSVVGQCFLRSHRSESAPDLAQAAITAVGGLRAFAAEIVWFRADRLQEEGRYVELAQLAKTLTLLEPHTAEVWSYAAWNLAYNVSLQMPTYADRWRWVEASLKLLRDEGLKLNPREGELYRELAFLFHIKIGGKIDSAAEIYRERWAGIMRDVVARDAWAEIGIDPTWKRRAELAYGSDDWTDPRLSAVYYAVKGYDCAEREMDRSFFREIVKQARYLNDKNKAKEKKS